MHGPPVYGAQGGEQWPVAWAPSPGAQAQGMMAPPAEVRVMAPMMAAAPVMGANQVYEQAFTREYGRLYTPRDSGAVSMPSAAAPAHVSGQGLTVPAPSYPAAGVSM